MEYRQLKGGFLVPKNNPLAEFIIYARIVSSAGGCQTQERTL